MAEEDGILIRSLKSQILDLPPSCVEFCPAHPSYFLVGTYSLEQSENTVEANADGDSDSDAEDAKPAQPKQPQSRNGSIIAFQLLDGTLTRVQTVPQPSALLDLRFNPHEGYGDICAVVSSTATLALFRLCPEENHPLKHLHTMDIKTLSQGKIEPSPGEEILFLSFGWHPTRADLMVITTSTGHVYLAHLPAFDKDWTLTPEPVITHTLETWCAVISPVPAGPDQSDGNTQFRVYSGGDDSMLRFRTCDWADGELTASLPATQARGHDAGVTAILPLFAQEDSHELVVTGSYDENIRLFSVPPYGRPVCLAESGLGGGVWRLKLMDLETKKDDLHSSWRARILASCMHAGTRVVELLKKDGEYQVRVLARFEEHKSMNYGSDFQPGWRDRLSVVSTSFYDKLLCFWEVELA
ncbi:hypothetical protein N0V88_006115 [Collariella sp. IMI 366227]|nr:hypothetical protein N0V88_006115 [Collariella sp. IMI 366227]